MNNYGMMFGMQTACNPIVKPISFDKMIDMIREHKVDKDAKKKKTFVLKMEGELFDLIVTPKKYSKLIGAYLSHLKSMEEIK